MPLMTLTAPGVEIHEIDKSGYTPAMTGTAVYLKGFASKGEAYKPMEFTSRTSFEQVFGPPDTEAERYFFAAACETLNQGGRLYAARLPYDNAAFEKMVGFKYKVNYSMTEETGALVNEDGAFHAVNAQDDQIREAAVLTGSRMPILYDLSAIDEFRTDENKVPVDTFLIVDTTCATYNRVPEDDRKGVQREVIGIVPVVTTAANAMYVQNYLSLDNLGQIKNYEVIGGEKLWTLNATDAEGQPLPLDNVSGHNEGLISSDCVIRLNTSKFFKEWLPDNPNSLVPSTMLSVFEQLSNEAGEDVFYTKAEAEAAISYYCSQNPGTEEDDFKLSSWMSPYILSYKHKVEGAAWHIVFSQVEDVPSSDVEAVLCAVAQLNAASDTATVYQCEYDAKQFGMWLAQQAVEKQFPDISAYIKYEVESFQNVEWKAVNEPFATEEARAEASALYAADTDNYKDLSAIDSSDAGAECWAAVSADTVSCMAELQEGDPRLGWHGEDFDDSVPPTLALDAANFFTPVKPAADGVGFDPDNLKDIGVVVYKAYLDIAEGNKVNFEPVEAFCGSLYKDDKDPNTGVTKFIDTIINSQSQYINFFSNCFCSTNGKKFYKEKCDILLAEPGATPVLGLYTPMTKKDISISKSILDGMNKCFDKVSNINERDIDIVPDAGVSNIASYLKAIFGDKGPYDLAITDELGNSMLGMWQCKKATDDAVKMWKTVVLKHDNFCKNIRKDCMFIADGLRPLVLQGQKKIVRDTKPANSIDKDILPFIPAICGINTNYGAGYANWFEQADDYTGDFFWCPPSIKAMGCYINTDLNFDYWLAPAGLTRGIVAATDVSFNPNGKQAGCFYEKNWNYAINYPQDGIILEGQKTFQTKPTALDRVNVRRMMLRLERAVYKVARYYVYENNTAYTRQRLVDAIEPIMRECWQSGNGGLNRYKIVCDESNNTPEVIDRNELCISIGVIPNKSAEFIRVSFILGNQSATWEELF